jgi:hypothetical protein
VLQVQSIIAVRTAMFEIERRSGLSPDLKLLRTASETTHTGHDEFESAKG